MLGSPAVLAGVGIRNQQVGDEPNQEWEKSAGEPGMVVVHL
jgi:hypothetical protein